MLNRLEIRNFQSLKKVDLELGHFTVIVGPSSSGKSALMRAFKALASNVRGTGVITRGQKAMAITARVDHRTVTLERTETSGSYRISDGQGSELNYTKLNGGVPDAVTSLLRIEPVPSSGTSINFASQFDRPYLLDESGANVARVLGELTNVTTIFEAVRAANKVRLNAAATLKTRRTDLQSLTDRLKGYTHLADRLRTLEQAEKLGEKAAARLEQILQLERAMRTLQLAETAYEKANRMPVIPPSEPLDDALNRVLDLRSKLNGVDSKADRLRRAEVDLQNAEYFLAEMQEDLSIAVTKAGVCPTCGRPV